MTDHEELDDQSLQMNLQYLETPIVFMKLEVYDAFKELAAACRELHKILELPWQKEHVTHVERGILEALMALDKAR